MCVSNPTVISPSATQILKHHTITFPPFTISVDMASPTVTIISSSSLFSILIFTTILSYLLVPSTLDFLSLNLISGGIRVLESEMIGKN
ncbi:hypothetical protein L6452_22905 [Arctium lappa]|uniref:Uncharacterized protein n=1 Tax=Arctium lappa TaxID=4217 RepID=A0ACB9B5F6_ARCLA|nr:hypothetical protein L6452_22905 [Arctium lappa]